MNLEETLDKIVELSREELGLVRKRGEEKTAAREHGHDFHEMQRAADRLDDHAHQLRRLHDAEFGQNLAAREPGGHAALLLRGAASDP